jgi:hypothetical protein
MKNSKIEEFNMKRERFYIDDYQKPTDRIWCTSNRKQVLYTIAESALTITICIALSTILIFSII